MMQEIDKRWEVASSHMIVLCVRIVSAIPPRGHIPEASQARVTYERILWLSCSAAATDRQQVVFLAWLYQEAGKYHEAEGHQSHPGVQKPTPVRAARDGQLPHLPTAKWNKESLSTYLVDAGTSSFTTNQMGWSFLWPVRLRDNSISNSATMDQIQGVNNNE